MAIHCIRANSVHTNVDVRSALHECKARLVGHDNTSRGQYHDRTVYHFAEEVRGALLGGLFQHGEEEVHFDAVHSMVCFRRALESFELVGFGHYRGRGQRNLQCTCTSGAGVSRWPQRAPRAGSLGEAATTALPPRFRFRMRLDGIVHAVFFLLQNNFAAEITRLLLAVFARAMILNRSEEVARGGFAFAGLGSLALFVLAAS